MAAKIEDVQRSIGQLQGTLEQFIDEVRQRHNREDRDTAATDTRLRAVEGKQYWLAGVGAGLSAAVSVMVSRALHGGSPPI